MRLDPSREATVRRMVPNRGYWPNTYLPMKRIGNDGPWAFGNIVEPPRPDRIVIEITYPVASIATFNSIEELIEAGWAVD